MGFGGGGVMAPYPKCSSISACKNALSMPLLVKKMLRILEMAIEFAVCTLWKLWKNAKRDEDDDDSVLVKALQAGAF